MRGRYWQTAVVAQLILSLIAPLSVWSAQGSLGMVRGVRSSELSLDGGNPWLPLGSRVLPIIDGAHLRSTTGSALLDFNDGSRLAVLPLTAIRLQEVGGVTEVRLLHGRLTFRLPEGTRLEIRTPSARLRPARQPVAAGEVFVGGEGTTAIRMTQGSLRVHELIGGQRVMLASLEPVFIPRPPLTLGPIFSSESPTRPPADAKSVFNAKGESLGYLRPDGQLVVHARHSADVTQPFPGRLIQLAMARIPEKDRPGAIPVFDVNGGYLGYLAGPLFYAQTQVAQAVAETPGAGAVLGAPPAISTALGVLVVAGVAVGGAVASGIFEGDKDTPLVVATPLQPKR